MNAKIIEKSFQVFRTQPCWGIHHVRILNLSMNFGKPSLHIREPQNINSKSEAVASGRQGERLH